MSLAHSCKRKRDRALFFRVSQRCHEFLCVTFDVITAINYGWFYCGLFGRIKDHVSA